MNYYAQEFCARIPLEANMDQCSETLNKKLTGIANPRTLVQPTISPHSHDITVWRQNPNVNHSQINVKTTSNPSLAGFSFPSREINGSFEDDYDDVQISNPYLVPLQPGIYTATDDFQPINNNLGISYPPQFPNTTVVSSLPHNEIYYDTNTQHANIPPGSFYIQEKEFELIGDEFRAPKIMRAGTGPESVYDPRFVGYGADNRSYTDELLGSAKYYYDDINAVRMPSYITRNKIDSCVTPCGDKYGDLRSGFLSLTEAKRGAEQSWRENSLGFRINLSKSLMRKKDEEMVQRRLAPKYTF